MITQTSNFTTAQYIELDQIIECDSQYENMSMSQSQIHLIDTSGGGKPYIHSKKKHHSDAESQSEQVKMTQNSTLKGSNVIAGDKKSRKPLTDVQMKVRLEEVRREYEAS